MAGTPTPTESAACCTAHLCRKHCRCLYTLAVNQPWCLHIHPTRLHNHKHPTPQHCLSHTLIHCTCQQTQWGECNPYVHTSSRCCALDAGAQQRYGVAGRQRQPLQPPAFSHVSLSQADHACDAPTSVLRRPNRMQRHTHKHMQAGTCAGNVGRAHSALHRFLASPQDAASMHHHATCTHATHINTQLTSHSKASPGAHQRVL